MDSDRLFPVPREKIILEKVRFFYLPDRTAQFIANILDGKVSERTLVCCHSGCDVCNDTIYKCYMMIKKTLEENKSG
ncbi:hypothetical protein [Leptospira sp. 'Mane']|uniref:hypothetical protein n=1 Tax=Leptospira sp. 'Mane' TaxID=3387407 RepID=UPI00398B25A7